MRETAKKSPVRRGLRYVFTALTILFGFAAFLILTQDIQLFPMAVSGLISGGYSPEPPSPVTREFVSSFDGRKIEVWFRPGTPNQPLSGYSAIFFRGNGGTLMNFAHIQKWLADMGADTAMFNYRGYGATRGWPNESALYKDTQAVWEYFKARTHADQNHTLLVGLSIGTGPAAYLASTIQPKLLVLLAPYSDIPAVAAQQTMIRWIFPLVRPFLHWKIPTAEFVSQLKTTNFILAHGQKDGLIPPDNGRRVEASYRGEGVVYSVFDPSAGHNDLFTQQQSNLTKKIIELTR